MGAMGRLIEQHHIIRHDEIVRAMKTGIIRLNDMEVLWIFLRKVIKKLLKVFSINPIIIFNH